MQGQASFADDIFPGKKGKTTFLQSLVEDSLKIKLVYSKVIGHKEVICVVVLTNHLMNKGNIDSPPKHLADPGNVI